ncbi:MAG: response regulator [Candidatus Paceibacterota bacterium]
MSDAPKKEKILIIEGNGSFGEKVAKTLNAAGYATDLVKNGLDGLKKIFDTLPHLVLLNVVLTDTDSYDLLAKKQAEPMLAKIPVFLISTEGVPINMGKVPAGSVAEYLMALHIDPREVTAKVNNYFGYTEHVEEPVSDAAKKRILWVEDDKLIGTILSKKLISSGFELIHAKNGEEAIESLKTETPDGIVLDLVLPGMSGFDILQKVKEDPRLSKVPAMILSNLSKQNDIERAKLLGAQKFLVKAAVSLDQIVEEVRGLCK